jgi:hypothetical protein
MRTHDRIALYELALPGPQRIEESSFFTGEVGLHNLRRAPVNP